MNNPLVSLIIPTYYGSTEVVKIPLESIKKQTCPKKYFEVILAHNKGSNDAFIEKISKAYGTKMITINGKPPQTCNQVNAGAKIARGKYIFIVDHDLELSPELLNHFLELIKKHEKIDAWYVPYKIVARGWLLNKIRNFEETFYRDSVIAAARIIKTKIFWQTENQYDPLVTTGPGDWDLTNQLKVINAKFAYIDDYVFHHEEGMNLWQFIAKKKTYAGGGIIYVNKWKKKNQMIYNTIVKKQYDPFYRLLIIFIEKEKWKILVKHIDLYLLFLFVKLSTAFFYYFSLKPIKK